MARRVSMATRLELVSAIIDRYRSCNRSGKRRILDEFVAVTGYHRKHTIRMLESGKTLPLLPERTDARAYYGNDVREVLIILSEASDRFCSKRLKVMLPALLSALEWHGRLALDVGLREKLLAVSAATIDCLLAPIRIVVRRRRRAGRFRCVRSATGMIRRPAM